jgi:hypothetical protein
VKWANRRIRFDGKGANAVPEQRVFKAPFYDSVLSGPLVELARFGKRHVQQQHGPGNGIKRRHGSTSHKK